MKQNRIFFFNLLLILIASHAYANPDYDAAAQQGAQIGASINATLDSSEALNQKLTKPTTSNETPMNPLQGGVYRCPTSNKWYTSSAACSSACASTCVQGFNAQLSAPSSKAFLDMFLHVGSTGDIDQAIFRQDLNFDGSFESTYTVPINISGICANGFISCTPGTWQGCRYFMWSANSTARQIGTTECLSPGGSPTMDPLGGCFCSNNSCGSNLVQDNLKNILESLGGGAVAALQYSKACTVTRVEVIPSEYRIVYYGQEGGSLGNAVGTPQAGLSSPESYFGNTSGLETAGANLASSQNSTPGTIGYLAANSPATSGVSVSSYTCSIANTPSINIEYDTHVCWTLSRRPGPGADDWEGVSAWSHINDNTCAEAVLPEGRCPCSSSFSSGSWQDYGLITSDPQCTDNKKPSGATSAGYRRRYYTGDHMFRCERRSFWQWQTPRDVLGNTHTGSCSPPAGCSLFTEEIYDAKGNSVKTWDKGSATSLKPLASCKTLAGATDTYTVCADGTQVISTGNASGTATALYTGSDAWFRIDRTYRCTGSGGGYNMDDYIQRKAHINSTLNATDLSNITFQDRQQVPGAGIITPDMSISSHPYNLTHETCEQVCTVRVPEQNTDASSIGNKSQYQRSTASFGEYLKPCRINAGAWECPVDTGAGEIVTRACGCSDDFAKTITTLNVLNDASKDMICSPK